MMIRALTAAVFSAALFISPLAAAEVPLEQSEVVILEPGRFLTEDDRSELERNGIRILRELGRDRYLARRAPVLGISAASERVARSARPIAMQERLLRVDEALLAGGGRARLQVLFYDDVPFDVARDAIVAAGGAPLDPLQVEFGSIRGIDASLVRSSVDALLAGSLVQMIRQRPTAFRSDNAAAAELSRVPPLREEYDLTGEGVIVSVYEINPLQADHPEFEGRATSPSGKAETHATHVSGTIAAAGLRSAAKGMAPKASIVGHLVDLEFVDRKKKSFAEDNATIDNNSWSFIVGWNQSSTRTHKWEWWGFTEEFGAYTAETEALDRLARASPTLMIYSAGNDNNDNGPTASPFPHYHGRKDEVWCLSPSGSGDDCPAEPCGATSSRCETTKHPADGPWTTVSLMANLKNGLGVGAVGTGGRIASFSSRGPSRDGRIKPDVVAKGVSLFSTSIGNGYTSLSGTSMAAPVVAGVAALLTEQWRQLFGGDPRPEFLRGLIIHGAEYLEDGAPNYTFGYGLVNAERSGAVLAADGGGRTRIRTGAIARGDRWLVPLELEPGSDARVTLAWTDPANVAYASPALVNDLDLSLIAPDGRRILPWTLDGDAPEEPAQRRRNQVDNTERIDWTADMTGEWMIEVSGAGVSTTAGQAFVVFSDQALGANRLACFDPYEPNETRATAVRLPDDREVRASVCGAADRDYYSVVLTRSGEVRVTLSSEVAVRVTMLSGETTLAAADVPAGGTRTLSRMIGNTPGQQIPETVLHLRIEPLEDREGEYLLRAELPGDTPNIRRGARR